MTFKNLFTVLLPSGVEVVVRPIAVDDAAELAAGFLRLSAQARFRRFLTGMPALSRSQLNYFTDIDHRDHEALVALVPDGGQIIGVARFVRSRTQPESAEIAVTIADSWQGRRLGTHLLRHLMDRARAEGITQITAEILPENRAMHALFRQLGPTVIRPDGSVAVDLRAASGDRYDSA